jgi:hypothetical protein
MKLIGLHFADVDEIREAVTDELKKVQREDFSAAFQKLRPRKSLYICHWSLFSIKKVCVFDLKKISSKTFGPHCVC